VNNLLHTLGIGHWKPALGALVLPPVPWLLLMLLGAVWLRQRRPIGWLPVLVASLGLWAGSTTAGADALARALLAPPAALGVVQLNQLREQAAAVKPTTTAVVVLGGGRERLAPEYALSNLNGVSIQRLRYGLWLGREIGAPVAFSGGVGWGAQGESPEAEVAARIARDEFKSPLKWTETRSRDTRENAALTVALLKPQGISRIVLVTHGYHMPRALRAFDDEVARSGGGITLVAAPMGTAVGNETPTLRWLPSNEGIVRVRDVLREWIGLVAGA
jgi:uncharacterized SAM-binding protein YcdF (DUF218 family)